MPAHMYDNCIFHIADLVSHFPELKTQILILSVNEETLVESPYPLSESGTGDHAGPEYIGNIFFQTEEFRVRLVLRWIVLGKGLLMVPSGLIILTPARPTWGV